jgi:hypothetical protein
MSDDSTKTTPTQTPFSKAFTKLLIDTEMFTLEEWAHFSNVSLPEVQAWLDGTAVPQPYELLTIMYCLERSRISPAGKVALDEFYELSTRKLEEITTLEALPAERRVVTTKLRTLADYVFVSDFGGYLDVGSLGLPIKERGELLNEIFGLLKKYREAKKGS